jgi:hypothetical protein
MDTGLRGSVGIASFLMAFNENADIAQGVRAATSAFSARDCATSRSAPGLLDSPVVDVDMGTQAVRLVEDILDDKIASSAMRIEGSVRADVAQLREQIVDCERSAKAESHRLAERIEAKCMDAWSAAVEELNGKIESLRQKLRDAELAAAQQQLDANAVGSKIESSTSETRGQLQILHSEFSERVELMQSTMDGTLQAFRAEMREWLDEERTATNERTQALGRALTEEFQHSIVEQATASARTEACAVTCQVVSKEFETWQKEGGAVQSDLVQVVERLSKLEKRLLSLDLVEAERLSSLEKRLLGAEANVVRPLSARNAGADSNGAIKQSEELKNPNPPRLEGMLLSILEKLDNKCIDSFATDMKELNTLLEDSRLNAGNIRELGPKAHDMDSTAYAASTTSDPSMAPSVAEISSASKGQDAVERSSSETSKGMGIQKLREDIFGYLRSEFQDVVSQTIAGINKTGSKEVLPSPKCSISIQPVAGDNACSPPPMPSSSKSPEPRHRELSRPKQGLLDAAGNAQRRMNHSPVHTPLMNFRQVDLRSGSATDSNRRDPRGSVGPLPAARSPMRLDSRVQPGRGQLSPPPSSPPQPGARPASHLPNGFDRGTVSGSHHTPLTPTGDGRIVPNFSGSGSNSAEAPRHSLGEAPRKDADRGAHLPTPLLVGQQRLTAQRAAGASVSSQPAFGRVQSTPAPDENRGVPLQAQAQRQTQLAARALSEAVPRGVAPQVTLRNRIGSVEASAR